MNFFTLSRKLMFGLLWGLWGVGMTMPVFADNCIVTNNTSFDNCKDKEVRISGPRVGMFDVPEYFMNADPSFTGEEGMQDYMEMSEIQIILHTQEEVQCPENVEVVGTLKQMELGEGMAWVIKVKEFKCL